LIDCASKAAGSAGEYLTIGDPVSELDFRNECKNYTNFRKVFRDAIKTDDHYCDGIGKVCEYTGSPGCGLQWGTGEGSDILYCDCKIEFTYCTQTSLGKKLDKSLKSEGKNEF